jgi:hypothetical protein
VHGVLAAVGLAAMANPVTGVGFHTRWSMIVFKRPCRVALTRVPLRRRTRETAADQHGLGMSSDDTYAPTLRASSFAPTPNELCEWDPSLFTDPTALAERLGRGEFPAFRLLVHTVTCGNLARPDGMQLFIEGTQALSRWDTISASVISDRKRFTYATAGVVLAVPVQNILLTSPRDLDFDGNVGDLDRVEHWLLPGQLPGVEAMPAHQRSALLSRRIFLQMDRTSIITPESVLERTHQDRNEVVVITRPGVNIRTGHGATGPVGVVGVFRAKGKSRAVTPHPRKDELIEQALSLARGHLNVPLIEIRGVITNVD